MRRGVNINKPTYENRTFIKNLEISFTILSVVLLTIGVMIIMYGSASFKNYYVAPVDGQKFFETIIEFLKVTIEYSTDFYVGILVICLSVISFIFAMSAFIYDFEFYQEKTQEMPYILPFINPENKKVKSVAVGTTYEEYVLSKNKKNKSSNLSQLNERKKENKDN